MNCFNSFTMTLGERLENMRMSLCLVRGGAVKFSPLPKDLRKWPKHQNFRGSWELWHLLCFEHKIKYVPNISFLHGYSAFKKLKTKKTYWFMHQFLNQNIVSNENACSVHTWFLLNYKRLCFVFFFCFFLSLFSFQWNWKGILCSETTCA